MPQISPIPSIVRHRSGRLSIGPAARGAVAEGLAIGILVWLVIEALSTVATGTIAVWPPVVMAVLAWVTPTVITGQPRARQRLIITGGLVISAVAMIEGLAFPHDGWFDPQWRAAFDSFVFRASGATMPVWVPLLVTLAVWGMSLSANDRGAESVRLRFQIGLLVLIVIGMIGAFSGMATETQIAGAAAAFFALMLLALGWSRQAAVHPGEQRGGDSVGLWTTVGGIAIVLVVAALLASIVNPAALQALLWLLSPAIWLVRVAILGTAAVLFVLTYPLFWLLQHFSTSDSTPPTPRVEMRATPAFAQQSDQASRDFSGIPDDLRFIMAAIILTALVTSLVRRFAFQPKTPTEAGDVEQHMDIDWRGLLPRLRRRGSRTSASDPLAGLRGDARFRNTVIIRETYADFLRRAESAGIPRHPTETARHHAERLAERYVNLHADLLAMEHIYGQARYDFPPASDGERERALAAWHRIRPGLEAEIAAE